MMKQKWWFLLKWWIILNCTLPSFPSSHLSHAVLKAQATRNKIDPKRIQSWSFSAYRQPLMRPLDIQFPVYSTPDNSHLLIWLCLTHLNMEPGSRNQQIYKEWRDNTSPSSTGGQTAWKCSVQRSPLRMGFMPYLTGSCPSQTSALLWVILSAAKWLIFC